MPYDPAYGDAISNIESGGRYGILGPLTKGGDRAYGKYQVMGSNVGPWTKEILGTSLTPDQFLSSPQAQDAVFQGKFSQYLDKYGTPQDAASAWFTGRPLAQGAASKDILGTTGQAYVDKFMSRLPPSMPAQAPIAQAAPQQAPQVPPQFSPQQAPQPQQAQPQQPAMSMQAQQQAMPNNNTLAGLLAMPQPAPMQQLNMGLLAPLLRNAPLALQRLAMMQR